MADPKGILGVIVARKRADVAARLEGIGLDELRSRAGPTKHSLKAALSRPGARFIMEVKRASPSGGVACNVDPESQTRAYRGAADAISVLTDTPFFAGSLDDLRAARRAFDGPILAKDFIVDLRQIAEARLYGADAVLAILSVQGPKRTAELIAEARRFNMEVLVEAHDERELRQALALDAPIIGINNRNLATLEVDLGVTERLAPLVPANRLLVAESGIRTRSDVERLAPLVDAFLVGSALMAAAEPALAARRLAMGAVKICGLTDESDARAAARAGAGYAGLIFVPASPRAVTRQGAEPIIEATASAGLKTVGVFRNQRVMEVAVTARALRIDILQLHGEEDLGYIKALRGLIETPIEIWGVAGVGKARPSLRAGVDRILFDTKVDGRSGGTGIGFDWSLIRGCKALPDAILAGGLGPHNARAAAGTGAFALDVGSGVEARPGRKDKEKMRAFCDALRPIARGEARPCA